MSSDTSVKKLKRINSFNRNCLPTPRDKHKSNHRKNFSFSGISSLNISSNSSSHRTDHEFGDYLHTKDLEWDRHRDFSLIAESDTMSSYDLNERMAELLSYKFLEFEIISPSNSISSVKDWNAGLSMESLECQSEMSFDVLVKNSSFDESYASLFSRIKSFVYTPPNADTLEDLLNFKSLTKVSISSAEKASNSSTVFSEEITSSVTSCKSMPDLRVGHSRRSNEKRFSLLDIGFITGQSSTWSKQRINSLSEKSVETIHVKSTRDLEMGRLDRLCYLFKKFTQIFIGAFGNENSSDEFKASYSAASNELNLKLNTNALGKSKFGHIKKRNIGS